MADLPESTTTSKQSEYTLAKWKKSYRTVQRVQQLKNTNSRNMQSVDVTGNTLTTMSTQLSD